MWLGACGDRCRRAAILVFRRPSGKPSPSGLEGGAAAARHGVHGWIAVFFLVARQLNARQAPTRPKHLRYSPVADRVCEMGRFGQKTSAGWYRYEDGSRTPVPDPDIEALMDI